MLELICAAELSVWNRTWEKSAPKPDSIRAFSADGMGKPLPRDEEMAASTEGGTETEA